ncbi:MAG: transcriptional regulator, TetR family [Amycolatopsis sp.]|jgi:DNA-binding transcriptional regulator YbjK|uniref:TetR/AcrR family transcriptional regulator n=1 Tax=Amycolatopsis sp. TaxID=37632 RepID=UPI002629869D|nr:TetR family transcriptional regulator C-terminal domain-containing protein [Amycolatopsis sp.]MCU1680529.1 transcriptional regulator, TetR family [Amycolatopsis sp.]
MVDARTPRQQRSQLRRDALLRAAVELIAEGGPQAITHRAVAARAGLASSTAGYFFASIDDLAAEALLAYTEREIDDYLSFAREAAGDLERLLDVVGHRAVDPRLALAQVSIYLEARRNPALRQPVSEAVDRFRHSTEEVLRSVGFPHADTASPAFVALLDGFMLQHLAKPDDPPTADELIAAIRALFTGFLLNETERHTIQQRLRPPVRKAD